MQKLDTLYINDQLLSYSDIIPNKQIKINSKSVIEQMIKSVSMDNTIILYNDDYFDTIMDDLHSYVKIKRIYRLTDLNKLCKMIECNSYSNVIIGDVKLSADISYLVDVLNSDQHIITFTDTYKKMQLQQLFIQGLNNDEIVQEIPFKYNFIELLIMLCINMEFVLANSIAINLLQSYVYLMINRLFKCNSAWSKYIYYNNIIFTTFALFINGSITIDIMFLVYYCIYTYFHNINVPTLGYVNTLALMTLTFSNPLLYYIILFFGLLFGSIFDISGDIKLYKYPSLILYNTFNIILMVNHPLISTYLLMFELLYVNILSN